MATLKKRAIITLRPEWEPKLDKLKKEQFYNNTKAEMFRYLIGLGISSLEKDEKQINTDKSGTS